MLKSIGKYAFSHRKTTILVLALGMLSISGFDYAKGDTGAATQTITASGLFFAVYILSGIGWSLSGFINNIRAHANYEKAHPNTPDPDWKGFESKKMKDDIFIGMILGAIAFITTAGINVPTINSLGTLYAVFIQAYGSIGLTDKIAVGAILNR